VSKYKRDRQRKLCWSNKRVLEEKAWDNRIEMERGRAWEKRELPLRSLKRE